MKLYLKSCVCVMSFRDFRIGTQFVMLLTASESDCFSLRLGSDEQLAGTAPNDNSCVPVGGMGLEHHVGTGFHRDFQFVT